jgi:methylated-DNA-[protein]-cysteine S-methyltransferase
MTSDFQKRVYAVCSRVPKGRITTYRDIGNAIGGYGQVYRAVGAALHKNPFAPKVPCHRVVNSNGNVGGFARGVKAKIAMLKKEGIKVKGGKIADFERVHFQFKKS